jgi:hypothetical protein
MIMPDKKTGKKYLPVCGGEGIRTLDTLSSIHTFQACQFNHSCTPPEKRVAKIQLSVVGAE